MISDRTQQYLRPPNMHRSVVAQDEDSYSDSDGDSSSNLSSSSPSPSPPSLIRNFDTDSPTDYLTHFEHLQLDPSFHPRFFTFITHHRSNSLIRARLNENSIEEVATSFLTKYGPQVWTTRGKNNHQDPKFREFFFHHKTNEYLLQELLEALWRHIRALTYTTPAENVPRTPSPVPSSNTSTVSDMNSTEEDIALRFIDKVHREIHGRRFGSSVAVMKRRESDGGCCVKSEGGERVKKEELEELEENEDHDDDYKQVVF